MRILLVGLLWLSLALSLNGSRADSSQEIASNGVPDKNLPRRVKRGWLWNQFFLQEEYTGSDYQYIGKLQSDQDKGTGLAKYVLSGEGAGTIFIINENNGDLHATRRLDREEKAFYILRATVVNKITGRTLEAETEFVVKLHDINDNEPQFSQEFYTGSVPEHSDIGTSVLCVTATDADDDMYGNSAKLVYSLKKGQPYFSVDPNTGVIRTALGPADMDREQREIYQVVIQAKDMAGHRGGLTGTTVVNISLTDVNDNPPRFTQSIYQLRVPELSRAGTEVGRITATDKDVGRNAEMRFTIISGDGTDVFDVFTNEDTQEGVLIVSKPLDYETKQSYTIEIQVQNTQEDPRFAFANTKDVATAHITVEDVDEPPVFDKNTYLMEIKEDAAVGTLVGVVSALDADAANSPVKYSIDRRTDMNHLFNVHPGNGTLFLLKTLDREENAWHNISVVATEMYHPQQSSHVSVHVKILDVNDNAPTFAMLYESFVCERTKAGQRIQTVSAVDADEPSNGHKFFFYLAPEEIRYSNFTVKDNGDNTGSIVTRRDSYSRLEQDVHLVPVVISDADYPQQSSTGTLTVRVCTCDDEGHIIMCNANAQLSSPGISAGVVITILVCVIVLLLIMALFLKLTRQEKKEPLIVSNDVRDNVVIYNEEGGGEEDTRAFDIRALYQEEESAQQRRDVIPADMPRCHRSFYPASPPISSVSLDNKSIREFINQRVEDSDYCNPNAPPYDSLATYAYEGAGSLADSLSSLESVWSEDEQDYYYLNDWGPRFKKLADMYKHEDMTFS
ncbi:cadherin-6-like isoform X1 [Corythoichthys intestinalis]|uniref:cadherin-6-like isoform X1 n=1 Tax=Corythoichthys intestinalis TaxID=161448 RepID=UPI0025A62DD7|nr:cadherin-6-like isoform X1 [Corythoichthys intestinalis]XP_057712775.1 cadherin-6-like isoform X1 [Corythoichthys intestinalis]XP_057712776.1 cadherin-6-like isoform X1 [Corythoichthys intestinalis]XP_061795888.1 cadherin-6-like [Nerophis lumbriciformis]